MAIAGNRLPGIIGNSIPSFVGFDHLFNRLDAIARDELSPKPNSFPPYNICKIDNYIAIELALAGFKESDIDITLDDGVLKIVGSSTKQYPDDNYIFKGIAERSFARTFTLADTLIVKSAEMVNGMLRIYLEQIKTNPTIRKIAINAPPEINKPQLLNENEITVETSNRC